MLTEFTPTIPESELLEGTMQGLELGDERVLIAKIDGEIYAINNICSHFHTYLSNGDLIIDRLEVQCPLHDSCFSLKTGEPADIPAEDPVEVYGVKIDGGVICVGPRAA
ncbi:nitrite reductase/ring-hydroxylating ferredoxin subunit [Sphingomonas vulcanisoli]|uniref:Nitrite reductase/ring-hydroxylating ferredoxin subunit n=1 Tax=Sphingomonas vulcanisoli TaxID=1658060 RepID=A0ABX0TYH3_9SPHN|nr:Rieske 2Fe-2S domain-containing protein [Sphingomonas vulcanisoli]NIJ09259.1 nitrite reductase/ring-hydroxylating ferredoxin subunit [Sphingomonas vulcanisoli]